MIFAVTAQTGGGKSYFCMRQIIKTLTEKPTTQIVTNLAIDLPALCQYLTEEYGEMFEAPDRIHMLTLEEVGQFWLIYGKGYRLDGKRMELRGGDGKMRLELDYSQRDPAKGGSGHSVDYVIDESDEIFDAKSFAGMSHDLRFYARHQRKFGDNVYLISPAWEFLVKELRVMCHAVWEMENGRQMKMGKVPLIGSLFRGMPWIKGTQWKVRSGGSWGGINEVPRDTTRFRIDPKGIGSTYRTEAGLGVAGNAATVRTAEKMKGLNPSWILVAGVAFCVAIFFGPRLFASIFAGTVTSGTKVSTTALPMTNTPPPFITKTHHVEVIRTVRNDPPPIPVYLSGYAQFGGRMIVYLSDGTQTDRFKRVNAQTVEVDGKLYTFAPVTRRNS